MLHLFMVVAQHFSTDKFSNSRSIWPFASFINLNFVPQQYRVLFSNMIGFFWSIVLSGIAASKRK